MSFLDTLGTLVGVGAAGGMLDEKGNFPEIEKPMLVDAVACVFAALVGTSTSGAYIESATGHARGRADRAGRGHDRRCCSRWRCSSSRSCSRCSTSRYAYGAGADRRRAC